MIRTTRSNPSFAPSTNASYTATRLITPYSGKPTMHADDDERAENLDEVFNRFHDGPPRLCDFVHPHEVRIGPLISRQACPAESPAMMPIINPNPLTNQIGISSSLVARKPQDRDDHDRRQELNARCVHRQQHHHRIGRGVLAGIERLKFFHRFEPHRRGGVAHAKDIGREVQAHEAHRRMIGRDFGKQRLQDRAHQPVEDRDQVPPFRRCASIRATARSRRSAAGRFS